MPGAKLSDDEFRQLEEKVLTIESGACWSSAAACRPASARKG
jgi:hypothetical protein